MGRACGAGGSSLHGCTREGAPLPGSCLLGEQTSAPHIFPFYPQPTPPSQKLHLGGQHCGLTGWSSACDTASHGAPRRPAGPPGHLAESTAQRHPHRPRLGTDAVLGRAVSERPAQHACPRALRAQPSRALGKLSLLQNAAFNNNQFLRSQ